MREEVPTEVGLIDDDPEQPRDMEENDSDLLRLGQNMLAIGQLVAVILFAVGKRFVCIDGHRRLRAARLVGIKFLNAIILAARPSAKMLRLIQICTDIHKVNLKAMARALSLKRLLDEEKLSINGLAELVGMKQPLVSKYLALIKLSEPAREALDAGHIDIEKAGIIAAEPDPAKQLEILNAAPTCSREDLRRKVRGIVVEPKVPAATFVMPGQVSVAIKATDLTLSRAISVLSETVRMLKKSQNQGLDISTVQRVFKDTAKVGGK